MANKQRKLVLMLVFVNDHPLLLLAAGEAPSYRFPSKPEFLGFDLNLPDPKTPTEIVECKHGRITWHPVCINKRDGDVVRRPYAQRADGQDR